MAKEPEHRQTQSEPPRYEAGKGTAQQGQPQQGQPQQGQPQQGQPQQGQPQQPGQSQKSQIAQYFRSQGKQPDDVILEMGGLKLLLKDLDG